MTEKATDYLLAGVVQVWVVDTKARSLTIFEHDSLPQIIQSPSSVSLLLSFVLSVSNLFDVV
ncbi:Uma2 family endonuclease [Chroococcidiopsis sp. TS-821]|uniref:Uma2 family endonuclease n=1 Tax=Chroococcidiopsis sp. TS-821 TaxID=1378066 RepID=UPI0011B0E974|nr:Uma2 family endonuclease [Chroococcidiopsis sp. TS-821]